MNTEDRGVSVEIVMVLESANMEDRGTIAGTAKVQRPQTAEEIHEEFVRAMWILFLCQNANPLPDVDGVFDLGVISNAREKNWTKVTPYSVAQIGE